ncbi:unnamed protein product [Adineta steineri]|uniref:Ribosomal RNA-processing protein 7 C-terminal domain-containing protein n=1 Tax=Adineta steineri TaxID=433720 RepID=A0A816GKX7_9BILA|nr:unnamed protein product [Adineta steineri]CAF1674984.1 unnamed protein product [Adineta steineri]
MKISNKKKKDTIFAPSSLHGISKWIKEYRDRFSIDINQLEKTSRDFLTLNKSTSNKQTKDKKQLNNEDDDDDKTLSRLRAKHKRSNQKKELVNFYKFQMTDKKIDQLEQLKMKFELDKQRITQMRQQRKFKPF